MKLETIERYQNSKTNVRNPFRNIQPFLPSLKLWFKSFEERNKKKENRKPISQTNEPIPIKMRCSSLENIEKNSVYLSEFEKKLTNIANSKKNLEKDERSFIKGFTIKPSLPTLISLDLVDSQINVPIALPIEKKIMNSEKTKKILQKKNRTFSTLENFEKHLNEISLKSFNEFSGFQEEKNPFLSFKLNTLNFAF